MVELKCAECVAAGQRSRVDVGQTISTMMALQKYFDEDGNPHWHDPNTHSTVYSCTNGHTWHQEYRGADRTCPTCLKAKGPRGSGTWPPTGRLESDG